MATAEDLATAHYLQQQRTVRQAADRAQALWHALGLEPGRFDTQWLTVGPGLVQAVTDGQQAAAAPADTYLTAVIAADGAATEPAGTLNTNAFAGHAADGRSLRSLLYEPVIDTKWRIAAGQSVRDATTGALSTLLRTVTTEVADAGRTAVGAGIASNRATRGYVRVLSPPSCSRCAILAGREYAFNSGFDRHPRCDCVHLPITRYRRGARTMDVRAYFDSLPRAEQNRVFTIHGAQAIRDGADINSVVNARRGLYTAGEGANRVRATYDATTARGAFFRAERERAIRLGLVPRNQDRRAFRLRARRLTPEEIYGRAENRDQVIAMLRRYGYLT
ncbi:hypothetical protein ACIGZJ_31225 [Kitasatospora sp. NPDC052868]|uniref:VG15 protein n=1 Tax=Kitasatospora sp. NPDC052868 TaxID=3364060 RepID=UPI0037CB93C4